MKTMKKIVAILAVALLLCSMLPLSVMAADDSATFDGSAVGNVNQKDMPTWTDPNGIVTITPDKGGNSNGIKYYTSGTAYRMYPKNTVTITVADGYVIDTVVITTVTGSNAMTETKTKPIVNATWAISGTTITLTATPGATSVSFGHDPSLSSGNFRFSQIVVNYSKAGGCLHEYDNCEDADCNKCSEERTAPGHKWDSCESTECLNCDATRAALDHTYTSKYATRCAVCGGGVRDAAALPADKTLLTILEANDVAMLGGSAYTTSKYHVTGVVESIANTEYGNLYIQDEDGNKLYVYGVYSPDGNTLYNALGDMQPQVGDKITLYGILGTYSGSAQMKSGWLVIEGACLHTNAVYDNNCEPGLCPDCGAEVPAIEAHSYAKEITVAATCTTTGIATYSCDVCSDSYTEELPLAAHNYVDGKCSVCNAEKPAGPTKIDSIANLTAGIYKMAGYLESYTYQGTTTDWTNNPWHVWTGAVNSGDLVTTPYSYDEATGEFIVSGADLDEGADIELIAVEGKANTYYICVNGQYLYSTASATNRKLALGDTPTEWVATDNANGGINLSSNDVYLGTAAASTRLLRSYKSESTLKYGVAFFAFDSEPSNPDCEHVWNAATCTAPATCALCGATDGAALGHSYVDVETLAPTCTTAGEKQSTCSTCNDVKTEAIAALGHNYVDGKCSVCEAVQPVVIDAPKAGVAYKFGMIQSNVSATDVYYLIGGMNGYYMATGTDVAAAIDVYLEETDSGYYMYAMVDGAKTYINMVVSDDGAHVNGAYETTASTVYTYNADSKTVIAIVNDTEYWFGTRNDKTFTTVGPCAVSYAGFYCQFYGTPCAHEYFSDCDKICLICGEESRPEAAHSVKHVEAKAATCAENGNIEYWFCEACGMAWLNAECTLNTNLRAVVLPATGEHTYDDEYDADCNVCGDIRDVPDKPVGDIIYGDANGDGEISTLDVTLLSQYLADWDVTLNNEIAADANGDGEISTLDVTLLSQYLADWDVQLGPDEPVEPEENRQYNDGILTVWPQA